VDTRSFVQLSNLLARSSDYGVLKMPNAEVVGEHETQWRIG